MFDLNAILNKDTIMRLMESEKRGDGREGGRKSMTMTLNEQNHTFNCSVGNGKYVDGHHLKQIRSADC